MLDHSQAVPLSDGHHILFLDNATRLLCLGSDEPAGSAYRLSRKFVFLLPIGTQIKDATVARVFAASGDTDVGVRVVAAYGERIVLYTVPADALKYSTAEQEGTVQTPQTPFQELESVQVLKHPISNAISIPEFFDTSARFHRVNMKWIHHLRDGDQEVSSLERLWPMRIAGSVIGSLEGVTALAVQESVGDGLTVWAFSKSSGMAKAWRVDYGERPVHSMQYHVDRDGFVGRKPVETDKLKSRRARCGG